jgi:hypothetical protein
VRLDERTDHIAVWPGTGGDAERTEQGA